LILQGLIFAQKAEKIFGDFDNKIFVRKSKSNNISFPKNRQYFRLPT
jgi:hypothetical protein